MNKQEKCPYSKPTEVCPILEYFNEVFCEHCKIHNCYFDLKKEGRKKFFELPVVKNIKWGIKTKLGIKEE